MILLEFSLVGKTLALVPSVLFESNESRRSVDQQLSLYFSFDLFDSGGMGILLGLADALKSRAARNERRGVGVDRRPEVWRLCRSNRSKKISIEKDRLQAWPSLKPSLDLGDI